MADHEDWKLGDEPANTVCPSCGKRSRPGLSRCALCGTSLARDAGDEPPLRSIAEAVGGARPAARPVGGGARGRERRWVFPAAATALVAIVAIAVWYSRPPRRELPPIDASRGAI